MKVFIEMFGAPASVSSLGFLGVSPRFPASRSVDLFLCASQHGCCCPYVSHGILYLNVSCAGVGSVLSGLLGACLLNHFEYKHIFHVSYRFRHRHALRPEFSSLLCLVAPVSHPGFPGVQETPVYSNFSIELLGFFLALLRPWALLRALLRLPATRSVYLFQCMLGLNSI